MKSKAASWYSGFAFDANRGLTQSEAADIFIYCWKSLKRDVITPAWDLADNDADDEGEQSDTEDRDFSLHDSEYDSEEDTLDESIDEEEVRIVTQKNKEPNLTPPRRWSK